MRKSAFPQFSIAIILRHQLYMENLDTSQVKEKVEKVENKEITTE
jgi:hypothetical protein